MVASGFVNRDWPHRARLIWLHLGGGVGGSGCLAAGAGFGGAEAVAVGAGLDDVGVEGEPVDDGGDEAGVGDDGAPLAEREVGGHSDGGSFFPLGQNLEEQLAAPTVELDVAQLVKAEQRSWRATASTSSPLPSVDKIHYPQ